MIEQLSGIVALCRVRYVYAADRLSIHLLASDGSDTGDDLTLALPCIANHVLREGDPPLLALRLFDPLATDGRTSMAPGPCPAAARATRRMVAAAAATVCHIPIRPRRGWLDSLVPGAVHRGELYLLPQRPDGDPGGDPPAESQAAYPLAAAAALRGMDPEGRLSTRLVAAGHARYPEAHGGDTDLRRAG